jgi:hypothetical protein
MWCPHCQSDVPHAAEAAVGRRRCCRCGRSQGAVVHSAGSDEGLDLETGAPAVIHSAMLSSWDDWTLAAEVQRARSLVSNAGAASSTATGWRIDARHVRSFEPHEAVDFEPEYDRRDDHLAPRSRRSPESVRNWPSLAAITGGVFIFCCGIVLAASLVDRLAAVGRLGVPLMLFGLFWLAMGVLVLLNRLRRESRTALDRMRLLDLRLREYRQAALLTGPASLGIRHRSEAPSLHLS